MAGEAEQGKLNRGLTVVNGYQLLKGKKKVLLTSEETFLASALGWCIEWLRAYFLVLDDIINGSHTRCGQPCWFRVQEDVPDLLPKTIGMRAANDGIILRSHISRILKKHFKEKKYYRDLIELFNEVEYQTALGQMMEEKDLSKYSMSLYLHIVRKKTALNSIYLPMACAALMNGQNVDDSEIMKDTLLEFGIYFQVQEDYLDCFGDPKVTGKAGPGQILKISNALGWWSKPSNSVVRNKRRYYMKTTERRTQHALLKLKSFTTPSKSREV